MGLTLTKNWSRVTAGDLEYIPDKPDFIDGETVVTDDHPVNEVHTGELPSEQDPRDKVEENGDYDGECEGFEIILDIPEVGDMTDFIENSIMAQRIANGSQRVGANPFKWAAEQAGKAGEGIKDYLERGRVRKVKEQYGEKYPSFNAFEQPEVQTVLKRYGLTDKEIRNFAALREQLLTRFKSKDWTGKDVPQWGQGLGQIWTLGNRNVPPDLNLDPYQQRVYRRWKPKGQLRYQQMNEDERRRVWQEMQKKYPEFWGNQQAPAAVPQRSQAPPQASDWKYGGHERGGSVSHLKASRSLGKLRNRINFVSGFMAMPRTAAVLRQAVDLVSAVSELDDGKSLDETTKSALRNTSRDLLAATDHLKSVNNRVANRVAGEIEQLYVDALSN